MISRAQSTTAPIAPLATLTIPGKSLQATFNVKDPRYGAKGDGVTDDIVAIEAALAAAAPTGGIIFFPAGKYMASRSIKVDTDSITIQGVRGDFVYGNSEFGNGFLTSGDLGTGTTIAPTTGFTSGNPLIHNNSTDVGYAGQTYDFAVRDLQLYCNSGGLQLTLPLACGIKSTAPEKCSIENVSVYGARGIGIEVVAYGPLGDNANIVACSVTQGAYTTTGIKLTTYEGAIINCQTIGGNVGFEIGGGSAIIGCTADGAMQYGFIVGGFCALSASHTWSQSGYSGIWIQGSYANINGVFLNNPGAALPGDFKGAAILKGGGAHDVTINGVSVNAGAGTTYFVYNADTSATRMVVTGCAFGGTPTIAKTFDAMTIPDSVFSGNSGVPDMAPFVTPASASAAGVAGTIVRDANYIYICTATNTWKRVAVSTW